MEAVDDHRRDSAVSDSLPKPRSHTLTDGAHRSPARAMLRACGLGDEDFRKPLVGVANTWIEIGPCNYHLRELAQHVEHLWSSTLSPFPMASPWARKACGPL